MLKFFDDWRLSKKLIAAFGFFLLLLLGTAYNSISSSYTLSAYSKEHVESGIARTSTLARTISSIKEMRIIVYTYLTNVKTKEAEAAVYARLMKSRDALDQAVADYAKIPDVSPKEAASLHEVINRLNVNNDRLFELRRGGNHEAALAWLNGESRKSSFDAVTKTEEYLHDAIEQSKQRADESSEYSDFVNLISFTLIGSCIALVLLIWSAMNRSVAIPLTRITNVTTALADGTKMDVPYRDRQDEIGQIAEALEHFRFVVDNQAQSDARTAAEQTQVMAALHKSLAAITTGDLTVEITDTLPPQYSELKNSFNASLAALRDVIRGVTDSTTAIRTGSDEIAHASEDLARRTESNAASLEETSAAVTQMDQRLRVTADAASQTVVRADDTMVVVQSGRTIADEAVQAMGRVSESAKGIDSVIEGLDKIAFQTRVLAMNAAVEAGRAGDAGRGFAVVADLVSALAMRSEEEAKRAREQLTATQTDIGTAVEAVHRVDSALENISGGVGEVNKLLREIADDNVAQSATITQISATIGTMDQATQQNAAMVEESSAAVRSLNSEVNSLAERTATFRIDTHPTTQRFTPPARTSIQAPVPTRTVTKITSINDDDWMDF